MPEDPVLCRGWTEPQIREAVRLASTPNQRLVLREIVGDGQTSAGEIAEKLGKSYTSVRSILAGLSAKTSTLGVKDPRTGEPSWPWTYAAQADGSSTYVVRDDVRAIIRDELGA
jgi:hypothetical protein